MFAVPAAPRSSPRLKMVSQTLRKVLIQIRLTDSGKEEKTGTEVSIPSNRGVLSDLVWLVKVVKSQTSLNPLKSGRPVGRICTVKNNTNNLSLNPLKSGRPVGPIFLLSLSKAKT